MSDQDVQIINKKKETWAFKLYIAGETPHGQLTAENLKAFCNTYIPERYTIETIDIMQNPERAEQDNIIAIPTIIKTFPLPERIIIGNFSNQTLMLMRLGILIE